MNHMTDIGSRGLDLYYMEDDKWIFVNAITANVWNYDPAWKVYWYENGVKMGEMKQFTGYDFSIVDYVNKNQSGFKHKGIGAAPTEHMFYAVPKSTESTIKIEVIDRFGNIDSKTVR